MTIYAIVSPSNVVTNLALWDGVTPFNVAPNTAVLATGQPNAQIGGTYLAGVFTAPAAPAAPQGILFLNSPVSGATISLPNAPQPQAKLYCYLTPAAALAALTVNLPTTPQDGDVQLFLSAKAIAAMTVVPAANQTLLNFPATFALAAGVSQQATYSAQLGGWFHL